MRLDSRLYKGLGTVAVGIALVASLVTTASAAFPLRSPQVPFNSAALQAYFNGLPESINCLTDQVDAQVWTANVSGNAEFTLMIELTGNAGLDEIGVYNGTGPTPLFKIFPGAASAGWFATAHFGGGNLVVTLFDNNSIIQGQNFYAGVTANDFGFYLQGPGSPGQVVFSQDFRNPGGMAQVLTYLGTGVNSGDWWECFEEFPVAQGGDADFNDAVLLMQSVVPTAVESSSWGKIKSLYRR